MGVYKRGIVHAHSIIRGFDPVGCHADFREGPLGYVVGGCFAMAGVLMFAQEMQRRRAKLLVPTDQLLRAIPTEVTAMLPSAQPSPRVQMVNRAFLGGCWG